MVHPAVRARLVMSMLCTGLLAGSALFIAGCGDAARAPTAPQSTGLRRMMVECDVECGDDGGGDSSDSGSDTGDYAPTSNQSLFIQTTLDNITCSGMQQWLQNAFNNGQIVMTPQPNSFNAKGEEWGAETVTTKRGASPNDPNTYIRINDGAMSPSELARSLRHEYTHVINGNYGSSSEESTAGRAESTCY